MNKTITGKTTKNLKPPVKKEETTVELARKVLATTPPVREDLVHEIKAKIKGGTYDVSSDTIASDIIEHLKEKA